MKRIILTFLVLFLCINVSFAYEEDYRQIYLNLPVPSHSYVHGIDPGQYYDNRYASYSVYPLFRLSSPLYFKTITVMPGYYALTPREYKGKDYILFKDCGAIKYIIPAYKKELVPQGFYETHLPKPKLTFCQRVREGSLGFLGKHFKWSLRKPAVKNYLEVNDLDNSFISIIVYYDAYRYYTIFRTVKL